MKNKLYEIAFSISHDGCWTTLIGDYVIENSSRYLDVEKGYVRSVIIFERKYKDIAYKIMKHPSFIDYYALYSMGKYIIFGFRKNTHQVLKTIVSLDGLLLDDFKYKGKEFWKILIYKDRINEFLEKLKTEGDVNLIYEKQYEVDDDILTPQELKVISLAYTNGYFNFPKSIKTGELARLSGVNKATIAYHLRFAERKIISRYFDDFKFRSILINQKLGKS